MAISFQTISKDPDSTLDYVVDWTAWLAPILDNIATVIWIVPTGILMTAQLNTTKTATVWLSGGIAKKTYMIKCQIATAGGRTETHSFNIFIEDH